MNSKTPQRIGIALGVLYGIAIRLLWELDELNEWGGLVTISFMFLVPFVIGYIRVHYECKVREDISHWKMITVAWQPIFIFLFVSVITLLEGSVCVAMALPAFMLFSSIGGVIAGSFNRRLKDRKNTALMSVALFPLLIAPLEVNLVELSKTYKVQNEIIIMAKPSVVWSQLTNVKTIDPDELPFSLTSLIGIPRPIQANMNASGVGAVRTSKWEEGVEFKEVITAWEPDKKMVYSFDIDPDKIPDSALDKHVKLGGEYFSPLNGGYFISQDPNGNTVLRLETTLLDNTNFGIYSRIWGELIFRDFHTSLLKLIKSRSEDIMQRS